MDKDYSTYKINQLLDDDYFVMSERYPTPENIKFWNNQIKRFPQLSREIELARKTIAAFREESVKKLSEEEIDTLWDRIKQENQHYNKKKIFSIIQRWSIAACFAVIIVGGWMAIRYELNADKMMSAIISLPEPDKTVTDVQLILSNEKELVIGTKKSHILYDKDGQIRVKTEKSTEVMAKNVEISYNQLFVPLGKNSSITFADGTKVWVNAGTRLVYPTTFVKNQREIYVEGEVFLEVAENVDRPFYVRTQEFEVRVLGTSFGIRAYEDEMEQGVVLVSGKVNVKTKDRQETVLTPNDRYVLQNGKPVVKLVDVYEYISWKDGVLCFERSCIGDILTRLEKYYGVEIDYTSEVKGISCSGKLELKNDLKEVLESLTKTAPIRYESVDNKIKVMKKEKESMK